MELNQTSLRLLRLCAQNMELRLPLWRAGCGGYDSICTPNRISFVFVICICFVFLILYLYFCTKCMIAFSSPEGWMMDVAVVIIFVYTYLYFICISYLDSDFYFIFVFVQKIRNFSLEGFMRGL